VHDNRLSQLRRPFILDRLELLKSTDLARARIDDLKATLFDLLSAYTSTTLLIDENRPIFRARKHREDEKEKLLDRVDEIYQKHVSSNGWVGPIEKERLSSTAVPTK